MVKHVAHLLNDLDNQTGGLACINLSDETLRNGTRRACVIETEATNVRVCACGVKNTHTNEGARREPTVGKQGEVGSDTRAGVRF